MFKLIHNRKAYAARSFSSPPRQIEMTLDSEECSIDELCEFFGDFLKACGYHPDGPIGIVYEDDEVSLDKLTDDFDNLMASSKPAIDPSQTEFKFSSALDHGDTEEQYYAPEVTR